MKKITILHVFPDDKFFDSTADFYDQLANVENRYYFYSKDKTYQFKYIKSVEKIRLFNSFIGYLNEFRRKDLDVVFFHSLTGKKYFFIKLIRPGVKIIWWSWGFDVYGSVHHSLPFINVPLYKPLTEKYMKKNKPNKRGLLARLDSLFYDRIRKSGVRRIDYFIPSVLVDYDLMKECCPFFRAKIFPYGIKRQEFAFQYHEKCGDVLVGNSLSYTNNHLDVFDTLYGIDLNANRRFIIPVNYGEDYGGVDKLISLSNFKKENVKWLTKFLSKEEYFSLFNNISHAVFGMMRQQGMGSVLYCLRTGVKVYVYKDSVIARQLRDLHYIFYTIEDDLNDASLGEALAKENAMVNYNIYMKRYEGRQLSDVEKCLGEVTRKDGL